MSRQTCRLRGAMGLLALIASGLASACPSDLPTSLSLTLLPGEILGVEHVLQVGVQDDGCLRVHRPAHWRKAGRFGGVLASPSLRAAQASAQLDLLAGFDGDQVAAELAALEAARGEAFAVEGADRYVLRWTDGVGRRHVAAFEGIFQHVERYPERDDLAAFAALVSMLQAEAAREDLVNLEAAP